MGRSARKKGKTGHLRYAKEHHDWNLNLCNKVINSDETQAGLSVTPMNAASRGVNKVYKEKSAIAAVKLGGRLGNCVRTDGELNAAFTRRYQRTTCMTELHTGRIWTFHHDDNGKRKAKSTFQRLQQKPVKVMEGPAQPPELIPPLWQYRWCAV